MSFIEIKIHNRTDNNYLFIIGSIETFKASYHFLYMLFIAPTAPIPH